MNHCHAPHPKPAFLVSTNPPGQTPSVDVTRRRALCGALLADGLAPGYVTCPRCLAALCRAPGYANALRATGWRFANEVRA